VTTTTAVGAPKAVPVLVDVDLDIDGAAQRQLGRDLREEQPPPGAVDAEGSTIFRRDAQSTIRRSVLVRPPEA
jgi:hypothetical protein